MYKLYGIEKWKYYYKTKPHTLMLIASGIQCHRCNLAKKILSGSLLLTCRYNALSKQAGFTPPVLALHACTISPKHTEALHHTQYRCIWNT